MLRKWLLQGLFVTLLWASLSIEANAEPLLPNLDAPHVPGEILVKFVDALSTSEAEARPLADTPFVNWERERLLAVLEAEVVDRTTSLGIERWRVRETSLARALRTLLASPGVAWAEPNYYLTLTLATNACCAPILPFQSQMTPHLTPNDPYYASYTYKYLARLGVESAWEITTGSPEIIVAVVDTGIACEHEDLSGHCWRNEDEIPNNGVDDDANGYVDDVGGWSFYLEGPNIADVHYHGTHVAGIVAATLNNNAGIVGIAPRVQLMPLAIFSPQGVGTYYDLIRAILYATDNGAHVINMSLGATTYSQGEAEAVAYAAKHGVVLVAAAGNYASNRLFYPAAHPQVIGVSATDVNDNLASFTNYGEFVDVAAPGVSILSTIPGNRYGFLSGTSMASPHVAGLAALLLSLNPTLSPAEVRALIETHAEDQVGPPYYDLPGRDPYYGAGRIHVGRAVAAATPQEPPPPRPTGEAPALYWPKTCVDVLRNGGFEENLLGWDGNGEVISTPVYEGTRALQLRSEASARIEQTFYIPEDTLQATFFAAVRIETADAGQGTSPVDRYDDWLRIWLVAKGLPERRVLLLYAGNTSDSVRYGLAWDEVLAVLPAGALPVRGGEVALVFETGSDRDAQKTTFIVDAVRLCLVGSRVRYILAHMP